jgi:hypothetical protein
MKNWRFRASAAVLLHVPELSPRPSDGGLRAALLNCRFLFTPILTDSTVGLQLDGHPVQINGKPMGIIYQLFLETIITITTIRSEVGM